jgi:hypothetical protein
VTLFGQDVEAKYIPLQEPVREQNGGKDRKLANFRKKTLLSQTGQKPNFKGAQTVAAL